MHDGRAQDAHWVLHEGYKGRTKMKFLYNMNALDLWFLIQMLNRHGLRISDLEETDGKVYCVYDPKTNDYVEEECACE